MLKFSSMDEIADDFGKHQDCRLPVTKACDASQFRSGMNGLVLHPGKHFLICPTAAWPDAVPQERQPRQPRLISPGSAGQIFIQCLPSCESTVASPLCDDRFQLIDQSGGDHQQ